MGLPRHLRWLLLVCGAVLLLESVFFSVLAPLIPYYRQTLGISQTEAGLLTGSEAAGTFLAAVPAGFAASRWGYKRTVLLALVLLACFTAGFGQAHTLPLLIATRLGQGGASALAYTGILAWLASSSPPQRRGQLLGVALGAAAFGELVGPVVGSVAESLGTAPTFTATALLFLPLAAAIAALPSPSQARPQPISSMLGLWWHTELRFAVWLLVVASLATGALIVIGPLRLDAFGWGSVAIAAVFVVGPALEGVVNPLTGRRLDRRGAAGLTGLTLAALGSCFLGLGAATEAFGTAVMLVAAMTGIGALSVIGISRLTAGVARAGLDQGLSASVMNLAWAPGNAVGAISAGVLIGHGGTFVACLLPAALSLGTVAFARRRR